MSKNLKDLAKQQMLDAKRKAKEESRKAAEKLRAQKQRDRDERKEWLDRQKAKRNFARRFQTEVLRPHYRSRDEYVLKDDLYIAKAEDGNIYGKHGELYFYSYQEQDRTYIRAFIDKGEKTISDGDHYPSFMDVRVFDTKQMRMSPFGRLETDSVYQYIVQSDCFWGERTKEYPEMKKVLDRVEKELKELKNTSKR